MWLSMMRLRPWPLFVRRAGELLSLLISQPGFVARTHIARAAIVAERRAGIGVALAAEYGRMG